MKELAMRMEKLPPSMVVHKKVATLDNRIAEIEGELVSNPLERNLGFYDFGRYTKVVGDADYAFEKMNDLWDEEIRAELNSEDETETEEDDEGRDNETQPEQGNETRGKNATKTLGTWLSCPRRNECIKKPPPYGR
jgi:hypothetical protein